MGNGLKEPADYALKETGAIVPLTLPTMHLWYSNYRHISESVLTGDGQENVASPGVANLFVLYYAVDRGISTSISD